jgi:hypothetical protein
LTGNYENIKEILLINTRPLEIDLIEYIINEKVETGGMTNKILELFQKRDLHLSNNYLLLKACKYGYLNIVKYLHSINFDLNMENDSPVYKSCEYSHSKVLEYLLRNGGKLRSNALLNFIHDSKIFKIIIDNSVVSINELENLAKYALDRNYSTSLIYIFEKLEVNYDLNMLFLYYITRCHIRYDTLLTFCENRHFLLNDETRDFLKNKIIHLAQNAMDTRVYHLLNDYFDLNMGYPRCTFEHRYD